MPDIDLFTPVQIGPHTLNNRLVMAPLTRNRASREGVPGPLQVEYYRQRATAGLILSEATCISPEAVGYPFTPGIWNGLQVAGWAEVTAAVPSRSATRGPAARGAVRHRASRRGHHL